MIESVILLLHIMTAISLVGLILIQHGKGAEAGASFGSSASQTVFGSQGSGNFLTRTTAILAAIFFMTSLGLGYLSLQKNKPASIDELLEQVQSNDTVQKDDSDIPKTP